MRLKELRSQGVLFLEALQLADYAQSDIARTAAAWGVSQADVDTFENLRKRGRITRDECAERIHLAAAMSSYVLESLAQVTEPMILAAGDDTLSEWREYYRGEIDRLFEYLRELERVNGSAGRDSLEDPAWCRSFAHYHRVAGLLWQLERQLGGR